MWARLSSPRLAAFLIGAMLVLVFASVVVPQRATLGAEYVEGWKASQPLIAVPLIALGADRVFETWPFRVVSALLTVNLVACTLDRIRRRSSLPHLGSPPDDAPGFLPIPSNLDLAERLRTMRGYRVNEVPGGFVCASGRWGFAGSIVMHAGLVLCVVAGVVSGLTRFEGRMLLVEGQQTSDIEQAYTELTGMPAYGGGFTGAPIRMDDLEFVYQGGTVTDVLARFTAGADSAVTDVSVNRPLRVAGKSYLLSDAGYSVLLRVTSPEGQTPLDAFVNLGRSQPDGYSDSIRAGRLHLDVLAVPDGAWPPGRPVPGKLAPTDPAVRLTASVDGSAVVRDVLVRPGGSASGGGWLVEVGDVRLWGRVNVRRDPGLSIAYAGFALAVFGMALRLLDPDRVVRVALTEGGHGVAIWARARWGPALARSAEQRVRRVLDAGASGTEEDDA